MVMVSNSSTQPEPTVREESADKQSSLSQRSNRARFPKGRQPGEKGRSPWRTPPIQSRRRPLDRPWLPYLATGFCYSVHDPGCSKARGVHAPGERPAYNPYLLPPPFWFTEEDPLEPIALALQMCEHEHKVMYKSLRRVGVLLKTNTVERHLEMVRALVEEAARLREAVNNGSFIILEQSKEIDRLRAELSKHMGMSGPTCSGWGSSSTLLETPRSRLNCLMGYSTRPVGMSPTRMSPSSRNLLNKYKVLYGRCGNSTEKWHITT